MVTFSAQGDKNYRATDEPSNFLDHVMGTVKMEKSGYRRQKLRVRGGGVVVHGMEREFEFEESFTKLSDPSGRMRKRVSIEDSGLNPCRSL